MRNALFNLKLASSADEDFVLRSCAGQLIELNRSLHNITDNASALLYEIQSTVSMASDSSNGGSTHVSHEINVRDGRDINNLNMAFK